MSEQHERKRVLILCTANSARSQMGEGLLRHLAGDRFEVFSAGSFGTFVRPQAIEVMGDIGIDISQHRSKSLDEFLDTPFDYVITVCDHANQRCPVFPGPATRLHWSVEDPVIKGTEADQLEAFRRARDDLHGRILQFLEENKS
jgi:arsenate reductase